MRSELGADRRLAIACRSREPGVERQDGHNQHRSRNRNLDSSRPPRLFLKLRSDDDLPAIDDASQAQLIGQAGDIDDEIFGGLMPLRRLFGQHASE